MIYVWIWIQLQIRIQSSFQNFPKVQKTYLKIFMFPYLFSFFISAKIACIYWPNFTPALFFQFVFSLHFSQICKAHKKMNYLWSPHPCLSSKFEKSWPNQDIEGTCYMIIQFQFWRGGEKHLASLWQAAGYPKKHLDPNEAWPINFHQHTTTNPAAG